MGLFAAVFNICFIVCHANPADHFAVFAEELQAKGCTVEIHAAGPALAKLAPRSGLHVHPFSVEGKKENEIAQACAHADVVITDVGHPFCISMQEALAHEAPGPLRAAYYDNPGDAIPGYSETAAQVMRAAQKVLFANANHAEGPILVSESEKRVGIGYYPLEQAAAVFQLRKERGAEIRAEVFRKRGLPDLGQKLFVYAGGNSEEYFSRAWPAFLQFLQEEALSPCVVLLQQHPGAKEESRDGKLAEEMGVRLWISSLSSQDAQAAADAMLYFQTSMAAQFVLAGIPAIQVGHRVFKDILSENGLCATATNAEEFLSALKDLEEGTSKAVDLDLIRQGLGVRSDWAKRLWDFIEEGK